MPSLFAEVAVNTPMPHRQTFSYGVPESMVVRPGHAVYVPFGRLTLQGIVIEVHDTPIFSEPEKIRLLHSLVGQAPLLDDAAIALAKWIAHEYCAPIFDAIALFLPPGFEREPVTFVWPLVADDDLDGLDLTRRQRDALASIVAAGRIDAERLELPGAVLVALERRGVIAREYALARPRIAAKTVEIATLVVAPDEARAAVQRADAPKHSRRAAVLERLFEKRRISNDEAQRLAGSRANLERLIRAGDVRYDREGHSIDLAMAPLEAQAAIRAMRMTSRAAQAMAAVDALATGDRSFGELRDAGIGTATVRWMADLDVVAIREEGVERDPLDAVHVVRREPPELLRAQAAAAAHIVGAMGRAGARGAKVFLLHGVTGSGKTEVYLAALDACVATGSRAIVLVPEIALTPQTVRRFRERFARVAVLHSGLSDGELFDQWHGIAAGRYDVVVGARSAIFAPQPDLGLIVIDEEHEWTYKQQEVSPRYHARDVAIERARLCGATVVLGSATPDVASFERATRGVYTVLTLAERIRPIAGGDGVLRPQTTPAMPRVTVVDMREELKAGNRSMFSGELRERLDAALTAGEQAILFLNRRGLAGHVQCRDCGYVPECARCQVAMTFHRQYDRLLCHQCNRLQRLPVKCRQCGSPRVRLVGAGVEKVEAEAMRVFPGARTLRWDRDVTRGKDAHANILASFLAHDADILIGTQMLAKGLDLPSVTVVGVVNADVGLHLPDFRAGERTFQLLTQVAGRAGRGERAGAVIIQTYQPDHYAIDAASRYDYEGFAAIELDARRANRYPPYTRLARLMFAHSNPRSAREEAARIARVLAKRRAELGSDVDIAGPSPAYVPRLRGRWRWQIMLRGRDPASLVRDFLLPNGWTVDIDPATLV